MALAYGNRGMEQAREQTAKIEPTVKSVLQLGQIAMSVFLEFS
jgi:hypothetical protein